VSGLAVHSTIRAVGAAVTEPRSQRTNSRTTAAGRATCVFDTRSNIWIGWQMLTVNSGWLGPNAMPTPAVNGRLASVMRTARTELRARRSDFENNSPIAPRRSLCRTALARVQAPPKKKGAVHGTAPQMPGRKRERNRNICHPPPAARTG